MEEKQEPNARGRALKGKIKTEAKYKGVSPGTLNIKVSYESDCLHVTLGAAQLSGKASQDPYALVYLLNSQTGLGLFQRGNNKTKTFKTNLKPDFNTEFQLLVNREDIRQRRLSLVVAIWDQDTDTRDDYMAGIRVDLQDFPFEPFYDWKQVQLKHQATDGHPSIIPVSEILPPVHQPSPQNYHSPGSLQGTPDKEPRQPTPYPSPQQQSSSQTQGGSQGHGHLAYPGDRKQILYPEATKTSHLHSPYPGGSSQTPYPGGQAQSPYPGGQPQSPYPGGQNQSPYPRGQAQSPYPGGQTQLPYPGGQTQSPYPGGQTQSPYPGGQTQSPYPGGQTQSPYPGGQTQSPYPGGQTMSQYPGQGGPKMAPYPSQNQ